jgi:F-type H+-transporting ATPase subunit b
MNLRSLFTCTLLAGAALAPSFAFAAGGAPAHMSMSEILWELGIKTLNVGLLGFLAFKYLSGPLNRLVEARSDKIREELEAAKSLRLEAQERLRAFQEKTARVDDEIEELRKQTCEDIDREQKLILQEARQAAEHIRLHARDTLRQEVLKARDDLHREASKLAAHLAEDIIRKNIDSSDHDRLIKEYVKEMEAAP